MIRKYGNQMVESEKYDKKYRLNSRKYQCRWPQSFGDGGKDQVLRLDDLREKGISINSASWCENFNIMVL